MHRPFLSLFLLGPLSLLPSRSWLHPEKLLPPSHTAAKGHLSCLFPRYRERVSSLSMAIFILFFVLAALGELAAAEPVQDRAALQAFLAQTPHERRVNWSASTSACDWAGVVCNGGRTAVVELHLPAVGLVGPVPPGTLGRLSSLRVLSLRSNALSGPIPDDLGNLTGLNSMFLQDNKLSGELPPSLTRLAQLNRLDLSGNNLTGEIPLGMNNLTHLKKLFLERNSFSGSLPSIDIGSLVKFNVSYNQLSGQIPRSLEKFQASSFVGNLDLCGGPLPPCSSPPAPSPAGVPQNPGEKSSKKLSTAAIVAISVAGGMVLLLAVLLLAICLVFRRRRRRRATTTPPPKRDTEAVGAAPGAGEGPSTSKGEVGSAGEAERSRLVFVGRGGGYSFDLEELLRASAEVLGKGTLGTSYKAVLEDGTTVVVKRLRDVAVGHREFEAHMETLGNMADHPNVLPLRAYYYSKDEKLLVFDYLPGGSLSSLLHGSRGSGRTPLDWESRMRVALAAGRGLVHLHASAALPHGNLKASNVILRHDPASAAVSDYALGPLFAPAAAPPLRVPGYRAPEVVETRRPSFKADVYSFGVLLLELLTGRAPNQAGMGGGDDGVDLPRWVQSVVREEWTAEVFDTDLMRYPGAEEEMVGLLQVGMACVATVPDVRPDMAEVVKMMEDIINRRETDDGLLQSSDEPTPHAAATP